MFKTFSPFGYWNNAVQLGLVMTEAQAVIGMRMLGMAGVWSVPPSEKARMISEKVTAMQESSANASRAVMDGKSPDQIAAAAIKPVRKATRANHKRLTRRGPKGS